MHTRRSTLRALLGLSALPAVSALGGSLDESLIRGVLIKEKATSVEYGPGNPRLRIAIVVGHNREARGAKGMDPMKGNEWDFWADQSGALEEGLHRFGCETQIFFRESCSSYSSEISKCYAAVVKELEPHGILELHYNDAGRKAPKGSLTLHAGGAKSSVLAEACQSAMEQTFSKSGEDRAALPWSRVIARKRGRGVGSLTACSVPTVIVEPAFSASNSSEAELLKVFGEEICWAIARKVSEARLPLVA